MDIRNGVTLCGSSPAPLAEQATNRKPQTGGMPQEANALGNARDMLTWGGYTGRHRRRKVKGLMTGVSDVLKTAEYNQSSAIQPVRRQATTMVRFSRCGADDNGPYAQEPCGFESPKHGFVAAVGWETTPPTVPNLIRQVNGLWTGLVGWYRSNKH